MTDSQENIDTKQALLLAAEELFALNGFDGTTVREISDKAGVNLSLVSYHFGGKKGVYEACFTGFHRRKIETVARTLKPANNKQEFIAHFRMYCQEVLTWYVEQPNLMTMIHREIDRGAPIIEDLFKEVFQESLGIVKSFIQAGKKKGIVKSQIQPDLTAKFIGGSLHQFGRNDKVNKKFFGDSLADPKYMDKVVSHIVAIIGEGLIQD